MTGPSAHARLSPSSAARWSQCPASVRLSEGAPRRDTPATLRGTALHAVSEIRLRLLTGKTTEEEAQAERRAWESSWASTVSWEEAEAETRLYVDTVLERLSDSGTLFIERRVIPPILECWGTADAIVIPPSGDELHVLDLKTGRIPVHPERNPQAILYAAGALEELAPVERARIQRIVLTIVQTSVQEVKDWQTRPWVIDYEVGRLSAAGDAARSDSAPCVPGETQCKWCPARGKCAAFSRWNVESLFGPVTRPLPEAETLSDTDLVTMLRRATMARDWMTALTQEAQDRSQGRVAPLPGLKVRKTTRRKLKKPQEAVARLLEAGYSSSQVTETRPVGLTKLTKLVGGADRLDLLLGDTLAHETSSTITTD